MDGAVRILHVDDDPDLPDVTAQFLRNENEHFTVETAPDSDEGLELLASESFDCVVSDYDMPGRNGIEFLQSVREDHPDLPFILFTGRGSEEIASDAISAGVTDYLQKQSGTEQYRILANRIETAVGQCRAEHELERQSDLFGKTQNLANVGAWEWYPQRGETYYSEQVSEIYAVDERPDASPTADIEAFYHPDDRERVKEAVRTAVEEGELFDVTARITDATGEEKWVRARGDPMFEDGECQRIRGTIRDITDRRERTQELERYQQIVEASGDAIYALDQEGYITMVNDTHTEWSGYSREELIGSHVSEFMPAEDVQTGAEIIGEILNDPEKTRGQFEMRGIRPEGDLRTYEDKMAVITDDDGQFAGSVGIIREITDRKRREDALETLTDATRELMDAPDKEAVADYAMDVAEDALSLEISALWLHDDTRDALVPVASTAQASDLFDSYPAYTGEGSLSWDAFNEGELKVVEDTGDVSDLLNPETVIESEIIVPLGDHGVMNFGTTESQRLNETDVSLARILGNTIETALSSADREQRLRRRRQEVKRQNEQLEEFISVVSHDLRSPLSVAEGCIDLAMEECESQHLPPARDAIGRSEELIDDLLTLAKQGEELGEVESVTLAELTTACWQTVTTAEARLETPIDRTIRADRNRLKQLVENLIKNAVDHGGSAVTVTVGSLPGGFYVEDDGAGIPESSREDVFEAGYTTAEEGTAFGLRIVQQVAEAHGWDITVTEGTDGGARFEVTGVEFAE